MTALNEKLSNFFAKVFKKDLDIRHIIFLYSALAGAVLSSVGAVGNFIMNLPTFSIIIPSINFIVDVVCAVYSIKTKKWKTTAIIVFFFASFVLFPFLWFTTGGTMSSNLPLIIGLGLVLIIVFEGKLRGFFFVSTLALYSAFIILELYHPNIFIPYPTREVWYVDVLIGFVLSFLASGGLAYITLSRHNAAKKNAEGLAKQLETMSYTDQLTGVYNRRFLLASIDEAMRRSFDSRAPLTVCIMDIDHFKIVNDTYGHLYGDKVLAKIAEVISGCISSNEVLGRYGGEEFVILFKNSDLNRSLAIIDNFLSELKNIQWEHGGSITLSLGVNIYSRGISYSKFMEQADANLYKAKNSGRNCVKY